MRACGGRFESAIAARQISYLLVLEPIEQPEPPGLMSALMGSNEFHLDCEALMTQQPGVSTTPPL